MSRESELIMDLQRELAFYFGAYHDQLTHSFDAAHCRENECERVKRLLYALPPAYKPMCNDSNCSVCRRMGELHREAVTPSSSLGVEDKFPCGHSRYTHSKDGFHYCTKYPNGLMIAIPESNHACSEGRE